MPTANDTCSVDAGPWISFAQTNCRKGRLLGLISKPRLGSLTQGSIFCGALAEDYANAPVWGLVITARCDTTHGKAPVVNYLPVVKVEDWLCRHGGLITLDRASADIKNRFGGLLSQIGLSKSLTEVYELDEIVDRCFRPPTSDNSTQTDKTKKSVSEKHVSQAAELAGLYKACTEILNAAVPDHRRLRATLASAQKIASAVTSELLSHRLAGYYFLPSIGSPLECESNLGYVVLLREVRHLPRQAALQLVDGVSNTDPARPGLCFECFDFACTVAELTSPWIEHLMQNFCALFGRIGIEDIDKGMVDKIVSSVLIQERN